MIKDVAVNKHNFSCLKKVSKRIGRLYFFNLDYNLKHLGSFEDICICLFYILGQKCSFLFSDVMCWHPCFKNPLLLVHGIACISPAFLRFYTLGIGWPDVSLWCSYHGKYNTIFKEQFFPSTETSACHFISDINLKNVEKLWHTVAEILSVDSGKLYIMWIHGIQGPLPLFPKRTLSWFVVCFLLLFFSRALSGFATHRLCKVRHWFGPQFPQLCSEDIGS